MNEHNTFITLTYDNEHLPPGGTLIKKHFQDFMKRFREQVLPTIVPEFLCIRPKIRFFHCGEYGKKYSRPHYHALIFGYEFPDLELYSTNFQGDPLYTSELLDTIWGKGQCKIGALTYESAAYVARYCTKKITGPKAWLVYGTVDFDTGELTSKLPEYATMSRNPGIGKPWLDRFMTDVYPSDEIIMQHKVKRPPAYYDKLYEVENPESFEDLKAKRKLAFKKGKADNTPDRLAVKEYIKLKQTKQLTRSYEHAATNGI